MANNITVENLNINGTLSATTIITENISSGEGTGKNLSAALSKLDNLPDNIIKTINGIPADSVGNVQIPGQILEPIDQSYTALEVYPTKSAILAGTLHPHLGYIINEISPCNTQRIGFRTTVSLAIDDYKNLSEYYEYLSVSLLPVNGDENDVTAYWTQFGTLAGKYKNLDKNDDMLSAFENAVISTITERMLKDCDIDIDWGDENKGHITNFLDKSLSVNLSSHNIKDTFYYKLYSANEIGVIVEHQYEDKDCDQAHTVTITGDTYKAFSTYKAELMAEGHTCVSKHLTKDYPINKNLTQIGYLMMNSPFVTSIDIPENMVFGEDEIEGTKVFNLARGCKNLLTVKGLKNKIKKSDSLGYAFYNCESLIECDLTFPELITSDSGEDGLYAVFGGCKSLRGTVDKFLPINLIETLSSDITINCMSMFSGCEKLTISDINFVKSQFWGRPSDIFNTVKDEKYPFKNCSLIFDQLYTRPDISPVDKLILDGWTGFTEDSSELSQEDRIAILEAKVAALEAQL